jgi:DNA-directed RNA polymerase beta' subunit
MGHGAGYNCDGDEIQLHNGTDAACDYEVKEIMGVNNHIISSQISGPIMGCLQDSLIGSSILTNTANIPKSQFMDCVFAAGKEYVQDFLKLKKRIPNFQYTGKNLFSVLLPEDFCYNRNNVVITNGVLISGTIDKKTIGKSYYAIHHRLFKEYSKEEASRFLSGVQRLINRFLIYHGFSIGVSDFLSKPEFNEQVKDSIQKAMIEAEQIQNSTESETIKEFKINSCLNSVGADLKLFGNDKNALEIMIKTGAKGNPPNMKQIRAYLGQNTVNGKRIQPDLDNKTRTLPCFQRGVITPETRGFIANCFLNGLTPAENFFHTMAGREGVINTAVKTQESGYTERKLVKRMENLVVEHDYTIRNSGYITSFAYGGDNMNATWLVNGNFIDIDTVVKNLGGEITEESNIVQSIESISSSTITDPDAACDIYDNSDDGSDGE